MIGPKPDMCNMSMYISSAENYRPISLTSIACQIHEHIGTSHLVKFLNIHNILYDLQHGFREKRSCKTQLVMLIEDLSRNQHSGKQTDVIFYSQAFYFRDIREDDCFVNIKRRDFVWFMHFTLETRYRNKPFTNKKRRELVPVLQPLM